MEFLQTVFQSAFKTFNFLFQFAYDKLTVLRKKRIAFLVNVINIHAGNG